MATMTGVRWATAVALEVAAFVGGKPAMAQFGGLGGRMGMGVATQQGQPGSDSSGLMGGFGGIGGGEVQILPIVKRPPHPLSAEAARTWLRLQQPANLPFKDETPLEDVVKFIRTSTQGPDSPSGIPIYVDPIGLQEAEKTLQSPITLEMEGITLASGLDLMLKQIGMSYSVRPDGIVWIAPSDSASVPREEGVPVTAAAARAWLKLQEPATLAIREPKPLGDVLRQLRELTREGDKPGIRIYVDPSGLQEAEKSMESPVSLDLEDVPLATALDLIARQLGLTYRVQEDGIVVLQSEPDDEALPEGHGGQTIDLLRARLLEEKLKAEIAEQRAKARRMEQGGGQGGFQNRPVR